jgi:hypothetical protein
MNTAETYRSLCLLRELGDTFGCKLSLNVTFASKYSDSTVGCARTCRIKPASVSSQCVYALFNGTVPSSNNWIASNYWIIESIELGRMCKYRPWLISAHYSGICLERLRKATKNVCQDNRCPSRIRTLISLIHVWSISASAVLLASLSVEATSDTYCGI